ncbi:endolytic transglycosylase MltG [Methylobacter sp. sgz302048]|uniref:endolytic transglycosylase MltG n=1 Tax=Methylobacter sp. sgz302048 TaxID=3455945 RepID=UPI003FA05B66
MTLKIIGFTLVIFIFTGGWAWTDYRSAVKNPVVLDKQVYIDIEKGDSLNRITDKLIDQNVAINPIWFKVFAYTSESAKKIKTGEYELAPGLNIPEILALFVQGKTKQYAITFPEGWSFKDILQEIQKNPYLEHTLNSTDIEALMLQIGTDAKHPEGMFFPDTYFFEKHMSDVSLLKRAYDKMKQVLQQAWHNKAENLPFKNPYEALILASIVEKETAVTEERPLIAGVFIRRLEKGMLLQTDPTVIYGMGEFYKGDITYEDLKNTTPYNTYVVKGLPPTPIAMPGQDAIYAALHPDNGDSLYFVSRGDGTHAFSSTLKDHNRAVDTFQRKKQ